MLHNQKGYTAVEMLTVTVILSVITISSANLFQGIQKSFSRLPREIDLHTTDRAIDQMAARLQRADTSSIDWSLVPPAVTGLNDSLTFRVSAYNLSNPDNPEIQQVTIAYSAARAALEETVTGIVPVTPSTRRIVVSNVAAPTAGTPLFEVDPTFSSILLLRVKCFVGSDRTTRVIQRRVRLL